MIPTAKKVKSSHKKGLSTFLSEEEPDEAALTAAITEMGYTVQSMEVER
jgi:hypothetical protein